jgi:carbamoyltransferase
VYIGRGRELRLLDRYGDAPSEISLGAAYNHFTKWLGFRSYHESGKVMALAAYGSGKFGSVRVFEDAPGRFRCGLAAARTGADPDPAAEPDPMADQDGWLVGPPDQFDREAARLIQGESVRRFIEERTGLDIGDARTSCANPDEQQAEVAWLIQHELERALTAIVRLAVAKTGIRRVCFAGGVALNCVANAAIARLPEVDELYIQPASSDVGQALGNALWTYWTTVEQPRPWGMPSCSLGRAYGRTEIMDAIRAFPGEFNIVEPEDTPARCAQMVADGAIIGWFDGGSEYGLRGLGRRSVLGDPRTMLTKQRLDEDIKRRERFRPYAPSIMEEELAAWFDVGSGLRATAAQPMRTMLLAVPVRPEKRALVPAVTFVDGTARLQAVSRAENPRYHALLTCFHRRTGIPMVLNTSFNAGGDPVVETPMDALTSMAKMGLDALALGDFLVIKNA